MTPRRYTCSLFLSSMLRYQDVYAYGVVLWEIWTRRNFFGEVSFLSEIQDRVLSGERFLCLLFIFFLSLHLT